MAGARFVRVLRVSSRSWQIGQCAVAAGSAWFIASDVLHHDTPFFAPIAAVVSLGTSYGHRLRRVMEVTLGVAVGVLLGDLLTSVIGSGGWQIAVVVALAMSAALFLDAGAIFVTQAAVQSIVVSTLVPDTGHAFLRWTDALVGGGVALIAASVVPRSPLGRPHTSAGTVLDRISSSLGAAASRIDDGDPELARVDLAEARATDAFVTTLRLSTIDGLSAVASSPFRRGHKGPLEQLATLIAPLDLAARTTRVLARRVLVTCHRDETVPPSYAALARDFSHVVSLMADTAREAGPLEVFMADLLAVAETSSSLEHSQLIDAEVVLAQVRSLIADLLVVTGMDPTSATTAIAARPSSAPR